MNHHTLHPIDNRSENKGIPFRYNQFLDSYDFTHPSWLIFCHEDFEFKQKIDTLFEALDTGVLYGPIGARTDVYWSLFYLLRIIGRITESNKDGSNMRHLGIPVQTDTPVETFDGQCIIVHSTLIQKTGLRFDENLLFDLYDVDFCINAKENHGVPSHILAVDCQHWSSGAMSERFRQQEAYLNKKYPHCCYSGTCSSSIGNPCAPWKLKEIIKRVIRKMLGRL